MSLPDPPPALPPDGPLVRPAAHEPAPNPWTRLDSRAIYENPWIRVREDQVRNPSGGPGIYGVVHFRNRAAGIIPLDAEGCTWLVGQYRYPLDLYSWEIPEGGAPMHESVLVAAQRELREETGLVAARWDAIARLHLSNSVSDEVAYLFLARDLSQGPPEAEATEDLRLRRLPLDEAVAMVMRGEITDAMSVAGLLKVQLLLRAEAAGSSLFADPLPEAHAPTDP